MLKNCLRLRAPLTSTYLRPTAEHGKGHVLSREFGDTGKTGPRSIGDTLFGCIDRSLASAWSNRAIY